MHPKGTTANRDEPSAPAAADSAYSAWGAASAKPEFSGKSDFRAPLDLRGGRPTISPCPTFRLLEVPTMTRISGLLACFIGCLANALFFGPAMDSIGQEKKDDKKAEKKDEKKSDKKEEKKDEKKEEKKVEEKKAEPFKPDTPQVEI